MGVGNYTERDVKECARAFTGWTVEAAEYMTLRSTKASIWPYGRVSFQFEYRPGDHDGSEKEFLGETGRFDGRDVIDIIVRQPATARFVATRLFLFFASDEVDEQGRAAHRRDGPDLLRLGLRDQGDAADPVPLRILQVGGGPVRQGEEPHRSWSPAS